MHLPFDIQNIKPFIGVQAITPSDTVDLDPPVRGLLVGVAGNVSVLLYDGTTDILPVLAGVVYHLIIKRVLATDTTATGIHGLY